MLCMKKVSVLCIRYRARMTIQSYKLQTYEQATHALTHIGMISSHTCIDMPAFTDEVSTQVPQRTNTLSSIALIIAVCAAANIFQ
jgi:hypothetical protein